MYIVYTFKFAGVQNLKLDMASRKQLCPTRPTMDPIHIRLVGHRCPYRHNVYRWPATRKHLATIISDSICKFIKETRYTDIQAFPGANVHTILWKVKLKVAQVLGYKIIILHVGTNDLESQAAEIIVQKYTALLKHIRRVNTHAVLLLSTIIPRPKDDKQTEIKRHFINGELRNLSKMYNNVEVLYTWMPFILHKETNDSLYARDGLHLNFGGTAALKKYFDGHVFRVMGKYNIN